MRLAGKEKKEKWLLGEKERREGKKGREKEREIVRHRTVFLNGARNILASSFLFGEKKKEIKNSSSSFPPSSPLFLILAVKNKEKK